jgi:hypothetical protein
MKKRSSARNSKEVLITPALVKELRESLVPLLPSGGGFRTVDMTLNDMNRIEIYSKSISKVAAKYGQSLARKLIDIEAGVLAAYINLIMLSKGFHIRYHNNQKSEHDDKRFVLELLLFEKDWE